MNKLLQIVFLTVALLILNETVNAQSMSSFKKYRYSSIGFSVNAVNYVGEVDPGPSLISPAIKFTRPDFSFCYIKRLKPRVSARASVSWGRIKGSDWENASFNDRDIHRKFRNLSFRNTIFEIKGDVIIDLWENRGRHTKRPDYTPYMFVGLAYFHHNPKALYKGDWVALKPLETEGKSYSLHQIALPVGLGFRYKLSKQWDLAFEMGWRFTLTDYLDDVSTSFKDKSTFGGNQTAIDLSDRSGELVNNHADDIKNFVNDPSKNNIAVLADSKSSSGYTMTPYTKGQQRGDSNRDWYIVTGFHLTYIIPGRVICPKFRTQHNDVQRRLLASID